MYGARPHDHPRAAAPARRLRLGATLAALLAGCADDAGGPEWIDLARGFRPALRSEEAADERAWTLGAGGAWTTFTVEREEWGATPIPGVWAAPLPIPSMGSPVDGRAPVELRGGDRSFAFARYSGDADAAAARSPDSFGVLGRELFLRADATSDLPRALDVRIFVPTGRETNGRWRVRLGRFDAPGIPALGGTSQAVVTRVPEDSVLRVRTFAIGAPEEGASLHFRIRLDGELLWEHSAPVTAGGDFEVHAIELPPEGARSAEIRFAAEGAPSVAAFLEPVIGPKRIGRYGDRPWPEERRSFVLFLADTFRADNLAIHGGDPAWTPELGRLAEESARFLDAWSVAAWTLPSHASLLSGLYPPQHGVVGRGDALSPEASTLAELFARAGWRTIGVTDSAWVSASSGFAQGFSLWDQSGDTLRATIERVESHLRADDGRPCFLFVQTYRAHAPYRAREGPELSTAAARGTIPKRVLDEVADVGPGEEIELRELAARLEETYREGVRDLDREVGRLLALLDELGLASSGHLAFTSDHGEAFFEHGTFLHGDTVFQELLRVPLLFRGPGIEPRDERFAASLVDVPTTLAALAGLEPPPVWEGRDLLGDPEPTPVFGWACTQDPRLDTACVVHDGRKVHFARAGAGEPLETVDAAFDVALDRGETTDLAASPPAWVGELETLSARELRRLREESIGPVAREAFDAEEIELLRRMGYLEDEPGP